MSRFKRLLYINLVVLIALIMLGLTTWWAQAQSEASVRIGPVDRDVQIQSTDVFTVSVENATDVGGFEFDLAFDPALLQIDDVAPGDFLGSTGRNTGELGPEIDNGVGTLSYGGFSYGSQGGPTGTGTLAVVTYNTTLTKGVSQLDLQNVQLLDTDAQTQTVQTVDGSLSVLTGPRMGEPSFDASTASDEHLTVTVLITNTINETGVATAALRCGYTAPYTETVTGGDGPGGDGNGLWTFTVPPQGDSHEGQTLHFSLLAQDGGNPPGASVDDNAGSTYTVTITDDDTAPPTFSNPAPDSVFFVYSTTLQVDIADVESGIADADAADASVYAAWDTDGELDADANLLDMDPISGTIYAIDAPIDPFASGITVTWRVYATDDDNSPSGAWSPAYTTQIIDTIFGDVDYDGDVDAEDIAIVAAHWNTVSGDPSYDPAYDFDDDGDIDAQDVMLVAAAWGNSVEGTTGQMGTRISPTQDGGKVSFEPSPVRAQAGKTFTMDITIADVTDLSGFEVDLLFEPQVITVTDVHFGDFLASSGNNLLSLGPRTEEDGRLVLGGVSYGAHDGASGSGVLATLNLALLSETGTTLQLDDVQLLDSNAALIAPSGVGSGIVETDMAVYLPLVLRNP